MVVGSSKMFNFLHGVQVSSLSSSEFFVRLLISTFNLCRTIIASLHYNENLQREAQVTKDGKICYQVTFPKFKSGDEVVRVTPVPGTYSKCKCFHTEIQVFAKP